MVAVNPELVKKFKELVNQEDYDALEYWYPKLNPYIKDMEKARKCCLITLASGNLVGVNRGRINCLLYDNNEGGTGKSAILEWLEKNLRIIAVGPRSSEVGLIYDGRDKGTKGALSMADGQPLLVEELSGFRPKQAKALRQALEKGYYNVDVGDIHKRIDARVRAIAVTNNKDKLDNPDLQRYDLKIDTTINDPEDEKDKTDHIYDLWFEEEDESVATQLREYIRWSRNYQPYFDSKFLPVIKKMKNVFIDIYWKDGMGADIRQKQTFLRTAVVIARLNHTAVTPDIFLEAIKLHNGGISDGIMESIKAIMKSELSKLD